MKLFHVEPPTSDDHQAWIAWMEADKKAAAVEKRQATMSLDHGDMNVQFAGIGFGFEGDFSEGAGEIVAVVQANQESDIRATSMAQRKRGSKRKRNGSWRRRARKARAYRAS